MRYCGDGIAAVVADNRYIAEDAPALIDVDFESLPAVVDQFAALKPGAPLVHPEWGDNVLCYNDVTLGDVDETFAAAHAIVSQRFRTGHPHAIPLEPRGGTADHAGSGTGDEHARAML